MLKSVKEKLTTKKNYKSIFISDIHLGTRGCKVDYLIDFLNNTESENIYLLGDIFDGWRLKKSWYWPNKHSIVVDIICLLYTSPSPRD